MNKVRMFWKCIEFWYFKGKCFKTPGGTSRLTKKLVQKDKWGSVCNFKHCLKWFLEYLWVHPKVLWFCYFNVFKGLMESRDVWIYENGKMKTCTELFVQKLTTWTLWTCLLLMYVTKGWSSSRIGSHIGFLYVQEGGWLLLVPSHSEADQNIHWKATLGGMEGPLAILGSIQAIINT